MIIDSNRRNEALEAGYRAMLETPCILNRVTFTLDEFIEGCKMFEVWGFFDDEPAGMVFLDKHHIHVAILKKFHGKCGRVIKSLLSTILKRVGFLIADVHERNNVAILFVKRLGFKYKENIGSINTYTLGTNHVF